MARVLVLAGTTEATVLAHRLVEAGAEVTSSLAGVTTSPVSRPGSVRTGGFGGAEGLTRYLRQERIDAVLDATHPFAAVMPFNAAVAARSAATPHCRLLRPRWEPGAGDRWFPVGSIAEAASALGALESERAFLAVGRQSAGAFARCAGVGFVVRAIEPIGDALPGAEVILGRGPFRLEDEVELLRSRRIDTVVAKNSGGSASRAKLAAARQLGIPVVMVQRPPQPDVPLLGTVDEAVAWYSQLEAVTAARAGAPSITEG